MFHVGNLQRRDPRFVVQRRLYIETARNTNAWCLDPRFDQKKMYQYLGRVEFDPNRFAGSLDGKDHHECHVVSFSCGRYDNHDTISNGWIYGPCQTALGRFGEMSEITGAIVFLSSDHASFFHSSIIQADGGQSKQYRADTYL